jgi:hypothetical protein
MAIKMKSGYSFYGAALFFCILRKEVIKNYIAKLTVA